MTKDQILEAIKKLSRLDRDEVLEIIVKCNAVDDLFLSTEQEAELNNRITDIENGQIKLLDGDDVMIRMAKKHDI